MLYLMLKCLFGQSSGGASGVEVDSTLCYGLSCITCQASTGSIQLARQTCLAETTNPACLPGSSLRVGSDFCTLALTALCTLRL